jgi:pimeloyl-ACP methyl ester carboxylesterase
MQTLNNVDPATATDKAKQIFDDREASPAEATMTHYHYATIDGHKVFYRDAGPTNGRTIVLLHGFPSSSHMFRDLIPKLASQFRVIAPDYLGFGYSDQPSAQEFHYTFDALAGLIENLLFGYLKLARFSIYVQDYGAPVGFRIASRHPEAIEGIIVQNGNAYAEGIGDGFEPLKHFWAHRNTETEESVRSLLTAEVTKFQYTHGAKDPSNISPDSYTFDQHFLDRPGNDSIQLDLFHDYESNLARYDEWHAYFRTHQPQTLIVWGQNDPFFTVEGAKAFLRDLPNAELHLLDTSHFALEEKSQEIADRIAEFLNPGTEQTAAQ